MGFRGDWPGRAMSEQHGSRCTEMPGPQDSGLDAAGGHCYSRRPGAARGGLGKGNPLCTSPGSKDRA